MMKVFPVGSSAEAMLDWISQYGLVLIPYMGEMGCGDALVETDWSVTISGQVLDTLGHAVAGAFVTITDASGFMLTTTTNGSGNYAVVGPFANVTLVQVNLNPKGYTNGPFLSQATIASGVNHGVIVMPPVVPTPIKG